MKRRQFIATMCGAGLVPFAHAQRGGGSVRIGYLTQNSTLRSDAWKQFFDTMLGQGWREGAEFSIAVKEARGDSAKAFELAREFVADSVDLVVAVSTSAALAAKRATDRIPIVTWCGYPVEAGLAASLARPGGNVTGVAHYANADVWGKHVELLREVRPAVRELGVLWDYAPPAFPDGPVPLPSIERAGRTFGMRTRTWMIRDEKELSRALSEIEGGSAEGLIISSGGGIHSRPESSAAIGNVVRRRQLPAITDTVPPSANAMGVVLAYAANSADRITRLARQVDRVLRGTKPSELPFELPQTFDLAVDVQAARAIGLVVPQLVLLRANRVIE